jgi:capsular polysaccharide biosynthesis protein
MERLRAPLARQAALEAVAESTDALSTDVDKIRDALAAAAVRVHAAESANRQLLKEWRRDADARARLAAVAGAATLADSIQLEGPPHRRLDARRVRVGEPFDQRFDAWMGVTRCVGTSPDVRALWNNLLTTEAEASGGRLRCAPSTILDVGPASISRIDGDTTRVLLFETIPAGAARVTAVPRFTCKRMPRKLRNFGHWLLDFLPQVVALSSVAPRARFLLPAPLARFQRATLALVGVQDDQIAPWDGAPVAAERLLLFLHDGRFGGGRPLSLIPEMQRMFRRGVPAVRGCRRLYVSRRDAKASRRWLANEAAVEELFISRGFEPLVMARCSLEDQVRAFRDAHIVAGVSGAGLSDIVFSAPGTHLIVLHSESLMRWYSDDTRARSSWMDVARARSGELAALGDSPRFYAHLAASLSQYCHAFLSGDEAPLGELARFMDEVLERAEKIT